MSSLIKIFKGAIYKDIYDLRADERKRTKYGVAEMIIDFSKTAPYIFNDSDKLYKNTTIVDDPYYETLCVINGEVRRPVYNGAHDKFEESSIEEYIEQLGQLFGKHIEIHEEAKKKLDKKDDNISIVREYANNCIHVVKDQFELLVYSEFLKGIKEKLNDIASKINIDQYNSIISDMNEDFKIRTYDEVTDIYEHNSENPKMIKQYPDLKNDYLALCEYAFYEPALKNLSYDSLILTREKSKDRIDDGIDKIRVKLKKNDEFGIILNNYSKILEVLKDK